MSSETYDETSGILGTLQDGRTIAKGEKSEIVRWVKDSVPPLYMTVTIPNLRVIDKILDINIKTISPPACVFGICQKTVTRDSAGNPVVGFTVTSMTYIASGRTAAGVTVTVDAVCIGW